MKKMCTENTWNHWHFDVSSITDHHLLVGTAYEQVATIKTKALSTP